MDEQALRQRLSNRLKLLRAKEGLTQVEVANRVGVADVRTYQQWESGRVMPLMAGLLALARAFEVDVAVLIARDTSDGTLTTGDLLDMMKDLESEVTRLEQAYEDLKGKR